MSVLTRLSDRELFLLTVPNDEEDSPWMVMADLQVRGVDLLKSSLLQHVEQHGLPWYVASYLLITMPRPVGESTLEVAPDLMVALAEDRLRESWSVPGEGKAPEFVLEVSSRSSWRRDNGDKPLIYDALGVQEYVIFAPERKDGAKLFGWRRAAAGTFVTWQVDEGGVLWSQALGGLGLSMDASGWLRARDVTGRRLPTAAEQAAEAEHRAAAEARARLTAEAELQRLREELHRRGGGSSQA